MADYYPLISRAVAGLEKNTGENRRALYERARNALVSQLRGVDPALEESEITSERLALEESIRKVEAEAAKRARPDDEGQHEPPPREPSQPSLRDQGLRGFRHTMAEAEGLGEAAAEANRSARATYGAVPGDYPPHAGAEDHVQPEQHFEPPVPEPFGQPGAPEQRTRHQQPTYHDDDAGYSRRPARSYGRMIKFALLAFAIAGLAAAGYWQRNTVMSMVAKLGSSQTAPKPADAAAPAGRPKIADRVGGPGDSATAPAAAVAQKVVLYDEDSNDPAGKRYVGSALWRTETVSPGPGLAPELAVRGDVEIPERRMRMVWSLRRNTDTALPASHTIEIIFTLPADFDQGGIGNVPGVLMKQDEQARGVPLSGQAVKVTNGYFLVGLSAVEIEAQRNIQLLKERSWFDIPLVYGNGRRGILAVEKGTPGTRAFEEAFRAWGQ